MLCLFYYLLCFLFNKIEEQKEGTGSAWKRDVEGWGEIDSKNVSKCNNDKLKKF
jgi:hypothetical protein